MGREAELAVLREQWEAARAGHPRVVVIEGMSGMGKTSLLSRFLREAAGDGDGDGDGEIVRISADEGERELSLGLVDQLLRMAGREGIATTATGARPVDVEAGLRVLATLHERQREAPLVVAVDDAHWADGASLHALLFAARRLVDSRVLLAIVACDSVPRALPDGLLKLAAEIRGATVTVAAFDVAELRTLAQRAGIALSPRAAQRLWRYTQGSPRHAWSLLCDERAADALPDTERRLAAPRRLAAEVAADLTHCSPDARALIEAVAVFGGAGCSLSGACEVARVAEPLRALDEATQAGLLTAREQPSGVRAIAFAQPLVAAAVYDGLGAARRSGLHAAIATGSDDEGAALRHGVGAALGPDGALAGRLEAFARDEAGRGAWESAASAFLSAGRGSERAREREQRMLRALNATIIGGDVERARLLAADVETFADEPLRDAVLGHLALPDMRHCDAERLLARAWERVDAVADPGLAALIAYRRAWQWLVRLDDARALEWSARAIELARAGDPMRGPAHAVHALALGRSGRLGQAETTLATVLEPASDTAAGLGALRGVAAPGRGGHGRRAERAERGERRGRAAGTAEPAHVRAHASRARAVRRGRMGRRGGDERARDGARARGRALPRRLQLVERGGDPGGARRLVHRAGARRRVRARRAGLPGADGRPRAGTRDAGRGARARRGGAGGARADAGDRATRGGGGAGCVAVAGSVRGRPGGVRAAGRRRRLPAPPRGARDRAGTAWDGRAPGARQRGGSRRRAAMRAGPRRRSPVHSQRSGGSTCPTSRR